MKPVHLFLTLAVTFMLSACSQEFTFVQMADTQIGFNDNSPHFIHSDTLMQKAVEAVNRLRPAAVIICGDLINQPWGEGDEKVFDEQNRIFEANLKKFDPSIDVRLVPGNHDIHGFSALTLEAYVQLRGYERFAFRKKGCAFIGFDTSRIMDDAPEAAQEQWIWLEEQLRKARNARFTFLFIHCPVFRTSIGEGESYFNFPKEVRQQYLDLFKKYGVDAVFAGHTHKDYSCEAEGIRFYVAGAVGNCLGRGYPGYHVVSVGKRDFEVVYTATPGVIVQSH